MPIRSPLPSLRATLGTWLSARTGAGREGGRVDGIPDALRAKADRWGELWGTPGLTETVTVEFSRRFRSSLGLCRPVQGLIRLAAHLQEGNGELLEEVLCHELAHVAVYRLHGRRVRPHGREWKSLMSRAGFEPRARFQREDAKFPPRSRKPGRTR